jgi:hypothetical protein
MKIEVKKVGVHGVAVHTKLSPGIIKQIAKIAKENKTTKAATINELLKMALK